MLTCYKDREKKLDSVFAALVQQMEHQRRAQAAVRTGRRGWWRRRRHQRGLAVLRPPEWLRRWSHFRLRSLRVHQHDDFAAELRTRLHTAHRHLLRSVHLSLSLALLSLFFSLLPFLRERYFSTFYSAT